MNAKTPKETDTHSYNQYNYVESPALGGVTCGAGAFLLKYLYVRVLPPKMPSSQKYVDSLGRRNGGEPCGGGGGRVTLRSLPGAVDDATEAAVDAKRGGNRNIVGVA
jgi:hypothetical protein